MNGIQVSENKFDGSECPLIVWSEEEVLSFRVSLSNGSLVDELLNSAAGSLSPIS
jgi:hypothetical protein